MTLASSIALDVFGQPPSLEGAVCSGLIIQSFVADGVVVSSANVTYLKVGEVWHRLALDAGTIHWRRQLAEPETWDVKERGWSYPHTNLGVKEELLGDTITELLSSGDSSGCRVEFRFRSGRRLVLEEQQDVVRYSVI